MYKFRSASRFISTYTTSNSIISFRLPTNNNQSPTIENVTKFGEIEAVKGEQELPKVKNEIDELMKSIPSPPRLELTDGILNVLKDVENVINNDFVRVGENDDKDIQKIKDEYNFDDIKNEFDDGKVLEILDFFCGGDNNKKFRINCEMLDLMEIILTQIFMTFYLINKTKTSL